MKRSVGGFSGQGKERYEEPENKSRSEKLEKALETQKIELK